MTKENIRVRFAPSPTGGLHLGGVRTALYNYLFAKHNNGKFILRIEDTDRSRYVEGAEQYIFDCLKWCGIEPDESIIHGGDFGPYRQSNRGSIYREYAEQLVKKGQAYYAFDTPEELAEMREIFKTKTNPTPKYDQRLRQKMRNSLTLSKDETQQLLKAETPYVIRLKVPENRILRFRDMIRGEIEHQTNTVDDKVLIKKDGMPTYHLAATVDDHAMKISHVFRGEEWLPSLPFHVLLWQALGWEESMPKWVHLPLIMKPSGKGKLSKRDGEKAGFPVFAMNWKDHDTRNITQGFKEKGFLPAAFVNFLAMLGWSSGTEEEIFSLTELEQLFTLDKVHKGGARFDYEKAKWYNHQYILKTNNQKLAELVQPLYEEAGINEPMEILAKGIKMIKERCHLLPEIITQSAFLFKDPEQLDVKPVLKKWNEEKLAFFREWLDNMEAIEEEGSVEAWHDHLNHLIEEKGLKRGAVMMPLRIMLVGGKFGPGVFDITAFIGKKAVQRRVQKGLNKITEAL